MIFYNYRPDANNYAGIGFSKDSKERVVDVHFTDAPLADGWKVPVAHGFEDNPEAEGDFPSLSNYNKIPVMSQRAWGLLRPLIGDCCEALPIVYPTGEPYFIIHVMKSIDGLDADRSTLTRNATTGRVNGIYKYAFKTGMLDGHHIFKLPLESGAGLFVDDVFRQAVESNHLKGLLFSPLPMAD